MGSQNRVGSASECCTCGNKNGIYICRPIDEYIYENGENYQNKIRKYVPEMESLDAIDGSSVICHICIFDLECCRKLSEKYFNFNLDSSKLKTDADCCICGVSSYVFKIDERTIELNYLEKIANTLFSFQEHCCPWGAELSNKKVCSDCILLLDSVSNFYSKIELKANPENDKRSSEMDIVSNHDDSDKGTRINEEHQDNGRVSDYEESDHEDGNTNNRSSLIESPNEMDQNCQSEESNEIEDNEASFYDDDHETSSNSSSSWTPSKRSKKENIRKKKSQSSSLPYGPSTSRSPPKKKKVCKSRVVNNTRKEDDNQLNSRNRRISNLSSADDSSNCVNCEIRLESPNSSRLCKKCFKHSGTCKVVLHDINKLFERRCFNKRTFVSNLQSDKKLANTHGWSVILKKI